MADKEMGSAKELLKKAQQELESKGFIYKDVSVTGPNGFTANSLTFNPTEIGEYVVNYKIEKQGSIDTMKMIEIKFQLKL